MSGKSDSSLGAAYEGNGKMWGIILLISASLGLILMIIGMLATGMFMLGYKKIRDTVSEKNMLKIRFKGMEVKIVTSHMFFAIVLGLTTIITSGYVSANRGDVGTRKKAERVLERTERLEEGGYTISENEIRIDLRNRRAIGVVGYLGSDLSKTERLERIVIDNIGSNVKEVNFRHGTSGHSICPAEKPANAKWRIIEDKSKKFTHPFAELFRSGQIFKNLVARKWKMRSYYLTVPIIEGHSQEIVFKLNYYNTYQGTDYEWAGKELGADTDSLTMHVVLPKDKPIKSFEAYKMENRAAPKIRIEAPLIEIAANKQTFTWKIQDGKKGEMYLIKWLW